MEHTEILAAVSSTVASVERLPNGPHPGTRDWVARAHVAFQTCGHEYVWHDWDLSGFPKPGDVVMCAVCIDALLKSKQCGYVATCQCVCDFPRDHAGMHKCAHIGPRTFGEHPTHAS